MQEVGHYRKIRVRKSPLHGWGVFADEQIQVGQLIEIAPGIQMSQQLLNGVYYMVSAEGLKPSDVILDQYGIGWINGKVFFPLGWVGLYNHSDAPLAEFFYVNEELLGIRCIKPISAGTEITVSYGDSWWDLKPFLKKA